MTFNMDAREDESYDKVGSQFKRLPAGQYHVEVVEVDETFQKQADKLLVTFEVLEGTIPGHVGERHTEFFNITENSMDRLKRLAMVCGLIKPGESRDVSFNDCVGRALIIEFVPNEYESKKTGKKVTTTQLAYGGFWALDHADVKDVPRGDSKPNDGPPDQQQASPTNGGDKWANV